MPQTLKELKKQEKGFLFSKNTKRTPRESIRKEKMMETTVLLSTDIAQVQTGKQLVQDFTIDTFNGYCTKTLPQVQAAKQRTRDGAKKNTRCNK